MEAVRVSGVCVAMLSHNSFICKYNIFSEPTNYQRQFYKTGRQKRELFVSFANCTVFFFLHFPGRSIAFRRVTGEQADLFV